MNGTVLNSFINCSAELMYETYKFFFCGIEGKPVDASPDGK